MVAQFHSDLEVCNCDSGNIYDKSCNAIYFDEVADVALKGINVTVHTPNISGIAFSNVSNISVQSTTVYSCSSNTCTFVIQVFQAETVQVGSVSAYKFSKAFVAKGTSNMSIILTTARYNNKYGLYLR